MSENPKTNMSGGDNGPWYRQFWAWFILAPLILVVLAWIPFMSIALKKSDDVIVDNYYKEGRMYNQRLDEDNLARQLGLKGELFVDLEVGEIVVTMASAAAAELPQQLELCLDHPVEEDNDLRLILEQIYPGRYLGQLQRRIYHRWYVRLFPAQSAIEVQDPQQPSADIWRITGELNVSANPRMQFGGDG